MKTQENPVNPLKEELLNQMMDENKSGKDEIMSLLNCPDLAEMR